MKFSYIKVPLSKRMLAFPEVPSVKRPQIIVKLSYRDKSIKYYALIDSGSDYCLFPARVGEQLGIEIERGIHEKIRGINGFANCFFHSVSIDVGGSPLDVKVGFSKDMDNMSQGILGQLGFFDNFTVTFDFNKSTVELKPSKV